MEGATPARLYATVVGAVLVIAGIIGFFYSASFGSPGKVDDVFGILSVNAWHNIVHIVTGALGLLLAGYAARQYALGLGVVYIVVAIWGFAIGSGESILGFIPINTEDNFLHAILGVLGIAAAMATPREREAREPTPAT
jgi:ABC-type transport system involved in multi-copper enzyme maturation permease subunit